VIADTVVSAGCRPIYDDELATPCSPFPPPFGSTVRTGTCGTYLVFAVLDELSMFRCFYDASTRGLVAEHSCTDTNQFCDARAFCTWQGPDIGACYAQRPDSLPTLVCLSPDAGTD
jgi:hypothetical protein